MSKRVRPLPDSASARLAAWARSVLPTMEKSKTCRCRSTAQRQNVLISETGTTDVVETGATDTFNVQLTTIPAAPVNVTVTADNETLLSTDGVNFFSVIGADIQ